MKLKLSPKTIAVLIGIAVLIVVSCHIWGGFMHSRGYDKGYDRGSEEMGVMKDAYRVAYLEILATDPKLGLSGAQKSVLKDRQQDEILEVLEKKDLIDSSPYRELIYEHIGKKVLLDESRTPGL
jgi:hypothetical protein